MSKRSLAIMVAFVMILQACTVFAGTTADGLKFFKEDFESYTVGEDFGGANGWNTSITGNASGVDPEVNYNAVANDVSIGGNPANQVGMMYDYDVAGGRNNNFAEAKFEKMSGEKANGIVTTQFKWLQSAGAKQSRLSLRDGDKTVLSMWINPGLNCGISLAVPSDKPGGSVGNAWDGSPSFCWGAENDNGTYVTKDTWNTVKFELNFTNQTVKAWWNGKAVNFKSKDTFYFASEGCVGVDNLYIQTSDDGEASISIDDIYVVDGTDITIADATGPQVAAAGVSAQHDGTTGTLRFLSKVTGGEASGFGACVLPIWIFDEEGMNSDKAATVSNDQAIGDGQTYAVDITGIPADQFDTEVYVNPFIVADGTTFWAKRATQSSINQVLNPEPSEEPTPSPEPSEEPEPSTEPTPVPGSPEDLEDVEEVPYTPVDVERANVVQYVDPEDIKDIPAEVADTVYRTYPEGKMKAFLLSFDDAPAGLDFQVLMPLLEQNNITCAFNMNMGVDPSTKGFWFNGENGKGDWINDLTGDRFKNECVPEYNKYEIGNHGTEHWPDYMLNKDNYRKEISLNKTHMETIFGKETAGYIRAYKDRTPDAAPASNEWRTAYLKYTGHRYLRHAPMKNVNWAYRPDQLDYSVTENFFDWNPTMQVTISPALTDKYTDESKEQNPDYYYSRDILEYLVNMDVKNEWKVYFGWGHSWDVSSVDYNNNKINYNGQYQAIVDLLEYAGQHLDVLWNVTPIEFVDYVNASRLTEVTVDGEQISIYNPSPSIDVWMSVNGENVKIPAGQTVVK